MFIYKPLLEQNVYFPDTQTGPHRLPIPNVRGIYIYIYIYIYICVCVCVCVCRVRFTWDQVVSVRPTLFTWNFTPKNCEGKKKNNPNLHSENIVKVTKNRTFTLKNFVNVTFTVFLLWMLDFFTFTVFWCEVSCKKCCYHGNNLVSREPDPIYIYIYYANSNNIKF